MLAARFITGLTFGLVVSATILLLPTAAVAVVFGLIWLAGAWEWAALAGLAGARRIGFVALPLGLAAGVIATGRASALETALLWGATAAWAVLYGAVLAFPRRLPQTVATAAGGIVLASAWVAVVRIHASGAAGPGYAFAALAMVWAADVGAYFVGKRFGHAKLAPRVSPGKTWEGVAGGLGLALVVGVGAALGLGLPLAPTLGATAVLALVSVAGDLSVSMLKRHAGLKDTGRLLPGHGGVMDRMDGLTAVLPFIAIGLQLAGMLD